MVPAVLWGGRERPYHRSRRPLYGRVGVSLGSSR